MKPVSCLKCKYCREYKHEYVNYISRKWICGRNTKFKYNCYGKPVIHSYVYIEDTNPEGKCKDYIYQEPKLSFFLKQPKLPDAFADFDKDKIK